MEVPREEKRNPKKLVALESDAYPIGRDSIQPYDYIIMTPETHTYNFDLSF